MPSKLIAQPHHMNVLLQQPESSQHIVNGKPNWVLQTKGRNAHDLDMADKHLLREGFGAFYAQNEASQPIGDSSRRHVTVPAGKEAVGKLCFRLVERTASPGKAFGKRTVLPNQSEQTLDDVYRGKRRVEPPTSQLQGEVAAFQLKHVVRDAAGKRVADRVSDPNERDRSRKVGAVAESDRRNGIPETTCGDKPYSAVEVTQEFATSQAPSLPRLGYEKLTAKVAVVDEWGRKEKIREVKRDVAEVRALPKY
jgi:hypothetical protein